MQKINHGSHGPLLKVFIIGILFHAIFLIDPGYSSKLPNEKSTPEEDAKATKEDLASNENNIDSKEPKSTIRTKKPNSRVSLFHQSHLFGPGPLQSLLFSHPTTFSQQPARLSGAVRHVHRVIPGAQSSIRFYPPQQIKTRDGSSLRMMGLSAESQSSSGAGLGNFQTVQQLLLPLEMRRQLWAQANARMMARVWNDLLGKMLQSQALKSRQLFWQQQQNRQNIPLAEWTAHLHKHHENTKGMKPNKPKESKAVITNPLLTTQSPENNENRISNEPLDKTLGKVIYEKKNTITQTTKLPISSEKTDIATTSNSLASNSESSTSEELPKNAKSTENEDKAVIHQPLGAESEKTIQAKPFKSETDSKNTITTQVTANAILPKPNVGSSSSPKILPISTSLTDVVSKENKAEQPSTSQPTTRSTATTQGLSSSPLLTNLIARENKEKRLSTEQPITNIMPTTLVQEATNTLTTTEPYSTNSATPSVASFQTTLSPPPLFSSSPSAPTVMHSELTTGVSSQSPFWTSRGKVPLSNNVVQHLHKRNIDSANTNTPNQVKTMLNPKILRKITFTGDDVTTIGPFSTVVSLPLEGETKIVPQKDALTTIHPLWTIGGRSQATNAKAYSQLFNALTKTK